MVSTSEPTPAAEPSPTSAPAVATVSEKTLAAAPAATSVPPTISLTATGRCTADGGYDGRLRIRVRTAPATITQVLVVPREGAAAESPRMSVLLPVTLSNETTSWDWVLPGQESGLAPTAVLVQIAELAGSEDGDGWLTAELRDLRTPCRNLVTPAATAVPTPTSEPSVSRWLPVVSLTAGGRCGADGGYDGTLRMRVKRADATITHVLIITRPGAAAGPAGVSAALPATLEPGTTNWTWRIEPGGEVAPVAIYVRIAELPGKPAANKTAADGRDGWYEAKLRRLSSPCIGGSRPTPESVETKEGNTTLAPVAADEGMVGVAAVVLTASIADLALPNFAYGHADQANTGTMTLSVSDTSDPSAGWNVTIMSSALVYSGANGGVSIPAANLALTTVGDPVFVSGQAIDATNGPKKVVPATLTLDAARKVIQANAGFGLGSYTQALGVALTVPGQSRAGTYTATLTVTISTGP